MLKKYVVELYDENVKNIGEYDWLQLMIAVADKSVLVETAIQLLPYTEPDLEQVRKEAYYKGYNEGCSTVQKNIPRFYEQGLNDAWEAAKKIFGPSNKGAMTIDEIKVVFGSVENVYNCTASEAIEKLKAYEERDVEIEVGDEVEWNGDRYVVTYIHVDETYVDVIDCSCGSVCDGLAIKGIAKTGRHFPEISTVLEKMKEGQDA